MCRLLGLSTVNCTTEGEIYICSQAPRNVPNFVASPRFAETKNGGGVQTTHFSLAQGLTLEGDAAIDMGGTTNSVSDYSFSMVLSRAKGSNWLVLSPTLPASSTIQEQSYGTSKIASAILAVSAKWQSSVVNERVDAHRVVASAFQGHLSDALGTLAPTIGLGAPTPVVAAYEHHTTPMWSLVQQHRHDLERRHVTAPRSYARHSLPPLKSAPGTGEGSRDHQLRTALRHYLPLAQDTKTTRVKAPYIVPQRRAPIAHAEPRMYIERELIPDVELHSRQHIEPTSMVDPYGPREATHHKGTDESLFVYSQQSRCPPRRDEPKLSRSDKARLRLLKRGFYTFFDEFQEFNEPLMEECLVDCMLSWFAGKTTGDVKAAVKLWEPDAPPQFIKIFQKGQWIKKLEARGLLKKSQVIAQVSLGKTCYDSIWASYLTRCMQRQAKKTTLLNFELNPSQLRDWYDTYWDPTQKVTANDYTGWDTGVDRVFLAFDMWLMESLGIPEEYRNVYYRDVTESRTYLGPYPIMQPSGNRYTWILNTVRNAALTGASLTVPPGTPAAFSGDDSGLQGDYKKAQGFIPHQWKMVPKRIVSDSTEFCGFTLGAQSLHVSSDSLAYRARIAIQRGDFRPDVWRSYLDLAGEADYSHPSYRSFYSYFELARQMSCSSHFPSF